MCCRKTGQRGDRGAAAGRSIRDVKHMPDLSCSIYIRLSIVYYPVELKTYVIWWRYVISILNFFVFFL